MTTQLTALLFLGLVATVSMGQAKTTTPVAVVDMGYIFKNHDRFKNAMETVKAQVQASEQQFQARGKDIEARIAKLKVYDPSSAEFKSLESETARLQAQVQADMAIKRKEFLEKEAQVFHAIYQEVQREIKAFADNNGIGLVLRFSSEAINSSNRQAVMAGVNRPVVYQRNLNITYDILDRLKRATPQRTARAPQQRSAPKK